MKYEIISSKEVSPEHFNIVILVDNLIISYFDLHLDGIELVYTPCFMSNQSNKIITPNNQLYEIADLVIKDAYLNNETIYTKPKSKKLYIIVFLLILFFTTGLL